MRILYIAGTTANAGESIALFNMMTGVRERGHEVAVVFPGNRGAVLQRFREAGFQMYCDEKYWLSIRPKGLNFIRRRRRLNAMKNNKHLKGYIHYVISDFNPDIIHTNVGPLNIAYNICRDTGIPHVWHLREYQDLDMNCEFYPSKEKFLEKIHSEGNHNIAVTQGIFDHWSLGFNDRIIYDGIFSTRAIPAPGPAEKEKFFLYSGRIKRIKGFGMLASTFKKFLVGHPDYQLKVVGKACGIYGLWWKIWCLINLPSGSVKYSRFLHTAELAELMKKAEATIIPSRFEAFGYVGVQAMLNACLVIGKNTSGMKEQFDNGLRSTGREIGLRFTTKQELLKAMNLAADGKNDFEQMKNAARQVVLDSYSIERNAELIEKFYTEMKATNK